LPYDEDDAPNLYEVVGRYIAQVIHMERFIDMALLDQGASPSELKRAKLARKIEDMAVLIERPELNLSEWHDLPQMMTRVARHRNLFAHRMLERSPSPSHYGQGLPYVTLSDDELHEQEWEAFEASEVCRQLLEALTLRRLNPGMHFGRTDPQRSQVW
jgi:hypothetical protein